MSSESGIESDSDESRLLTTAGKPNLLLHIGPGKTGSSAIQAWLSRKSEELARCGFLYPRPEGEAKEFTGNGQGLAGLLNEPRSVKADRFPEVLEKVLVSYRSFADEMRCHTILLSSEFFPTSLRENLELFKQRAELYFNLKVVGFVRDPYWWLWSCWGQSVKRAGMYKDFATYALKEASVLSETISQFVSHFDNVQLLVYQANELLKSFTRAIGVPDELVDSDLDKNVNRSLCRNEIEVLLAVNRTFQDAALSQRISDQMLRLNPHAAPYKVFDPLLAATIREANEPALATIRRLIINPEVPLIDDAEVTSDQKAVTEFSVDRATFDLVLTSVKAWLEECSPHLLLQQMAKQVSVEEQYEGLLPERFNSIEYLLLNPDVLAARVDPITHYIKYGRNEGRAYCRPGVHQQGT